MPHMTAIARQPLGQLLVGRGLLQSAQLDAALEAQRRSGQLKLLGEILVEAQSCTEAQVAEALAEAQGIPYADVGPLLADASVLAILPRAFIELHDVLPLFLVEDVLTLAMAEPADLFALEEARRLSGKRVQVVAATAERIAHTLRRHDPRTGRYIEEAAEAGASADFKSAAQLEIATDEALDSAQSAAAKLLVQSLRGALNENATEIHIEPGAHALRIRCRVDGQLVTKLMAPIDLHRPLLQRLRALANLPVQSSLPHERPLQIALDRKDLSLHLCTMPGPLGDKAMIRLAQADRSLLNLEKLGFAYDTLKQWKKLIARPSGLVIVSGAGGVSTLYASLMTRNQENLNVCTLEESIAMPLEGVNQFAAEPQGGLDFAAALQAVLKQEPDVIMLGDLPDGASARIASNAALAGRLVLAAALGNDPASLVRRLVQLGIDPYVLSMTLGGVLVQRLVRKLCPACKQAAAPTISQRRQLERIGGSTDAVFEAKGCDRCKGRGYAGRTGIFELLIPDEALIELIARGASPAELRAAMPADHVSLQQDGLEKVRAGVTSFEELFRVAA